MIRQQLENTRLVVDIEQLTVVAEPPTPVRGVQPTLAHYSTFFSKKGRVFAYRKCTPLPGVGGWAITENY